LPPIKVVIEAIGKPILYTKDKQRLFGPVLDDWSSPREVTVECLLLGRESGVDGEVQFLVLESLLGEVRGYRRIGLRRTHNASHLEMQRMEVWILEGIKTDIQLY